MDETLKKKLDADTTGLLNYEYLANNIGTCDDELPLIVNNIVRIDADGQFTVSAARYLAAIDADAYADRISTLIAAAINKDRDHKYIGALLSCIWGDDYENHVEELSAASDNFRRIYKRMYPQGKI